MNAIPSKDFNTTGPRNSKLSKHLFNNKSNLIHGHTLLCEDIWTVLVHNDCYKYYKIYEYNYKTN